MPHVILSTTVGNQTWFRGCWTLCLTHPTRRHSDVSVSFNRPSICQRLRTKWLFRKPYLDIIISTTLLFLRPLRYYNPELRGCARQLSLIKHKQSIDLPDHSVFVGDDRCRGKVLLSGHCSHDVTKPSIIIQTQCTAMHRYIPISICSDDSRQ